MAGNEDKRPGKPIPGPAPAGLNDEEPPLDPAVERVRRKLVRLLIGSFGIMILGLIAVFSTIVYRLTDEPGVPAERANTVPATANIALPNGAKVLSASVSGSRTLLHIHVPGEAHGRLVVIETDSGKVIGRFKLEEIAGN